MNRRNILVGVLHLTILVAGSLMAQTPFTDQSSVIVSPNGVQNASQLDPQLEKVEQSVSKGLVKAKKAMGVFTKELDLLAGKLDQKIAKTMNSSNETPSPNESIAAIGNQAAGILDQFKAEQKALASQNVKEQVASSFKGFWDSLIKLFKALGSWGKSFWQSVTGPSADEAPITNTINGVKTDFQRWQLGNAWGNFTQSGKDLGGALGRFAKNLFN